MLYTGSVLTHLALLLLARQASPSPLGIGCNVESLSYYDADLKVCDQLHAASEFGVPEGPWKGAVPVDANGWPMADFSVILYEGQPLSELWVVRGAGRAPQIAPNACSAKVLNTSYDPATDAFESYVDTNGQGSVILTFTGTSAGIRNLSVWRTSCPDAAATFHPAYLAHISRCTLLRFLDFEATNDNNRSSWAADKPLAYPQWSSGGAPWSAAIALANAVGADVWINVPTLADDAYVTQLAMLLHAELRANATIYGEYSNELWNFGFEQFHWQVALANASVYAGDPFKLNYSSTEAGNVYYWANRLTAYQAAVRIPRLFQGVFGQGAVGLNARVRPILAGQVAFMEPILQGLRYLESVWGPPSTFLHAIAGAPYFGAGTANTSTVPELLARVASNVAGLHPAAGWGRNCGTQQHATLAAWYRVFFHGYEGGPDFSGAGSNYTLTGAAQRDPGFTPIMTDYFLHWAAYGNTGSLNQFEAGASGWSAQFGCWGLVERITDTTSTKLAAFDAARSAPRPPNALGIPVPTVGFPAGYFSGCAAASASAAGALGMHASDPLYLYPVNLAGLAVGARLRVAVADHYNAAGQMLEVGLNGAGLVNITATGVAYFVLTAEDVGGAFGGVAALGLRGTTAGAYYIIDNITITLA